jgi:hypothetical protein
VAHVLPGLDSDAAGYPHSLRLGSIQARTEAVPDYSLECLGQLVVAVEAGMQK